MVGAGYFFERNGDGFNRMYFVVIGWFSSFALSLVIGRCGVTNRQV